MALAGVVNGAGRITYSPVAKVVEMSRTKYRLAILVGAAPLMIAAMAPGGHVSAPGPLMALRGLEQGQWELRERGSAAPARRICVGDPIQLMQPQHPGGQCRRFVVTDAQKRAVVTYQCSDAGSGRTDLRVETSRLVQIDAQGIADSQPFAVLYEARKTGECH